MDAADVSAGVLAAVADIVGAEVRLLGATPSGESKSAFRLATGRRELVLKLTPSTPGAMDNRTRLTQLVGRLRSRGYPAPEYLGAGRADDVVFTVQRRLPGRALEPAPGLPVEPGVLDTVLPAVLDAVEIQRDAGDLPHPPWPHWLLDTIDNGGAGYCLHETMRRRADTSALLRRLLRVAARNRSAPVRTTDVVHFDMSPANILHQRGRLTGIIDWDVPFDGAGQGDREHLWETACAISGLDWVAVYLCHLVLRQVEWTARHRPSTPEETRFLRIAHHALDDCERRGA
jgi:Ser/Thr protein kinase RdoA (MazF antagonist)